MRPTKNTLAAALCLLACWTPAVGQNPAEPPTGEAAEVGVPQQSIEVDSVVGDNAIRDRLVRILESSKRFEDLELRVENGVVFLGGSTETSTFKSWASELILRTKDVTAIVNDIEVVKPALVESTRSELAAAWKALVAGLPIVAFGLLILVLTMLVSRGAARLTTRVLTGRMQNQLLQTAVQKVVQVVLILAGVYVFLRISGLTRVATTILGGTGLLGLVLGLAFRDIAENLLASLLISIQRPFRLGDKIEVAGHFGIVQRVTLRGTVLMDLDGNHVQIANSTIYKDTIKNFTANPKRRIEFGVGIGYDADVQAAQELAKEVVASHSAVLAEPEPTVLLERLGSATVDLRIYCWVDGVRYSTDRVRSALMRRVLRAFDEHGVSLPDESREVIFPQGVPVRMLEPGEPYPAPVQPAVAPAARVEECEVSTGEGELESEDAELQRQARESRVPDDGADILGEPVGEVV